jgi:hypothetical protein
MAINKNHEFEELNGVKCAIVEKNASKERVEFLKQLLEFNRYTVVVVPSPPPKAAPAPKPVVISEEGTQPPTPNPAVVQGSIEPPTPAPETFSIGVTNVAFNPTNAIFGRLLRTKDGHFVTLAYWEQKDSASHDDIPYYEQKL